MKSADLVKIVRARADESSRAWFDLAVAGDRAAVLTAFPAAGRRLGRSVVALRRDEDEVLWAEGRTLDEVGRVALLLACCERLPAGAHVEMVEEVYRAGEEREKVAVLQALPVLPEPGRFVAIGRDACRSNTMTLFEAIACENPYPSRHFDDEGWNQMIMKAVMNRIPLARVAGLRERHNAELDRMARAYESERRAAGRPVPEDLAIIKLPEPTGET